MSPQANLASKAVLLKTASVTLMVLASWLASPVYSQVLLQPVVLELLPRQKVLVVAATLSEKAPAPIRLQAELLRWNQDAQGRALTEGSDDLLVSPPIAELRPGQRQVFRLAMRHPKPLAEEAAYRLILEDISPVLPDDSGKPGVSVHIRMRYDLPVMVAPAAKVVQALQWKPCEQAAGATASADVCVRLRNSGNRRLKLQALQLKGDGWQQTLNLDEGGFLLAGAEREWRAPVQAGSKGPLRDVQAQTSRGETLQVEPRAL